jgi:hypothetical protein
LCNNWPSNSPAGPAPMMTTWVRIVIGSVQEDR